MTNPVSPGTPLPPALLPVHRLAVSRQRLCLALHPPATPSWTDRAQAAWRPSVQRHPWVWVLGAVLAGGVGALVWRRLPPRWLGAVKGLLQTAGQEALWSWWLGVLAAQGPPAHPPSTQGG